ncbi:hypothetical protein PT974_02933 [Cladobotryum mycophilum]|uniref:AAA+ ATPase domain-containing protein n=1 Tax=Cladobotryum mycophilum TaxID=491253 RepID=A0ABR0SZF2_9HYPO
MAEDEKAVNGTKVEEEPTKVEDKTPRSKLMHVQQIWNSENSKWEEVKDSQTSKPKDSESKQCVIKCVRRGNSKTSQEFVVIHGRLLRAFLKHLTNDYAGPTFSRNEELAWNDMKHIWFQRQNLVSRLDKQLTKPASDSNEDFIFEIQAGIDLLTEKFGDVDDQLADLQGQEITYKLLWTLFPPHTFVTGSDSLGQERVFRVQRTEYTVKPDGSPCAFQIDADYIDTNGEKVGFVNNVPLYIAPFRGGKRILELGHYPVALRPDYALLREALIERADKVQRLRGMHLQEYTGHAISEDPKKKFNSHGRIVIDAATFERVKPNNQLIPYVGQSLDDISDDHKLLINPVLYGFSLGDKVWGAFAVSQLQDVVWNTSIIDALVISSDQKEFMRALVESHSNNGFDDFVRDKGKGLIGLLTGSPGVGKTLTAEAVAEIAHRPLYMISSGELGSHPESVQQGLDSLMELSEAWNAVVLLDEADVFLVERDDSNLTRNAITSIFLRRLEYYQGILLLTTNRQTSFDPAFKSRIHFCLQYPDLNAETRRSIWSSFMARSDAGGRVKVDVTEDEKDRLAELPLNGRQIKNIMNITQTVAVRKGEPITYDGLHVAMGFSHHIFKDLSEMNGHSSS